MSAPLHEIIVVPPLGTEGRDSLWEQCFDVRLDVFHHEQGFPADTEKDEYALCPDFTGM